MSLMDSKTRKAENPTIKVKDFGPIGEAEVELRPLTVFAGPSDSGKSWLATLVYAVAQARFNSFSMQFSRLNSRDYPKYFAKNFLPSDKKFSEFDFPENPGAMLECAEKGEAIPLSDSDKLVVKRVLEDSGDFLKDEIPRCFGQYFTEPLIRYGSANPATVSTAPSGSNTGLCYDLSFYGGFNSPAQQSVPPFSP